MTAIRSVARSKLLVLCGLLLLSVVVVTVHQVPPADGYEISIYQAYPWYFWVSLIGAIFLGQLVILQSASRETADDHSWYLGVWLIFLANSVLLFMPFIRGYPAYGRADLLSHLGLVQDLAAGGGGENIYPFMHTLTYGLSQVTETEPIAIINLLSPVFSFVFLGGLFYTVVQTTEDRTHALFCLPFVTVLIGGSSHMNTAPFALSVLYVPFILYLFIKGEQTNAVPIQIALVISVLGLVIYHPLTTVFLLFVFAIYRVLRELDRFSYEWTTPTMVIPLLTVAFSAWYLNFAGIIRRFESIIQSLFGSAGGTSEIGTYASTVGIYSPALPDLVQIGLQKYGIEALLLTLGGLFVILTGYLWIRNRSEQQIFMLLFIGSFILFTGLSALFFSVDLIVGFARPLLFMKIFTAILAGSLCYWLWRATANSSHRRVVMISLGIVLFVLVLLTVGSVYPSPGATERNHQVTEAEITGTEWLFENRDQELLIEEVGITQYRFDHLQNGTVNTTQTIRREDTEPPRRFGYDRNTTLAASYQQDTYLMTTRLGEVSYPAQFPDYQQYWRYTPDNFEQLEHDQSVSRLYDNGDFRSYYINASSR